jgi:hypothetical protein
VTPNSEVTENEEMDIADKVWICRYW